MCYNNALLSLSSQAGIDGSGQVLGCGDSGVDVDNCYFYDESVPFSVGLNVYGSQVRVLV